MTVENYVRTVTKGRMVRMPKMYSEGELIIIEILDSKSIKITRANVIPEE